MVMPENAINVHISAQLQAGILNSVPPRRGRQNMASFESDKIASDFSTQPCAWKNRT